MKAVSSWMFFGVMIVGLTGALASARAQPPSKPAAIDDDMDDDEMDPIDDAPPPRDSKPQPRDSKPPPSESKPPPKGGEPAIGKGTLAINGPDKPWSRGVSMENRKAARALFLEGNRLFRIPLFTRAAEKYVAALGKWKHPIIYLNLALAQLNTDQDVKARESLEHALEQGEEALGAENFQGAQLQLREIERQLGRIRVSCRTPGAQVTLDGVLLFTGPGSYEGWVKAKDHEITAKNPEYLSEARRVTVSSGQFQAINLKLITLREAAEASRRWKVWKPWSFITAGGAITAFGGMFHALASREFKSYDRAFLSLDCANALSPNCHDNDSSLEALSDQLKLAKRERAIAAGSYVVGGSLFITGLVLLYLNQPRLVERIGEHSSDRSLALMPTVSGDMCGILVNVTH